MVSLKNYNKYDIWIKSFIIKVGWSNDSFAIALTYINWETDAIVGVELLQNVGIAIVCIFVTTLITLGMSASLSQLESTSFSRMHYTDKLEKKSGATFLIAFDHKLRNLFG